MSHPYRDLPAHRYWRQGVLQAAEQGLDQVDVVVEPAFKLDRGDRFATAGSCFARHVTRHLRRSGVEPLVTESAHPLVPANRAAECGFGDFTARYGNIYTSRQLRQLMARAFGEFEPREAPWRTGEGRWLDPFRPTIQPGGFLTAAELVADRAYHFDCVRRMFSTLDVFVFTLGLTECWASRDDGAVFPVCPGASGGVFDAQRYEMLNLGVDDVCADMLAFVDRLRKVNPRARVILTVSPVPLVATGCDRHVMVATTYSKSVLRVAAEQVSQQRDGVAYFPSFEIITGGYNGGAYFGADLRSVTERGVEHVMRLFLHHYLGINADATPPSLPVQAQGAGGLSQIDRMDELVRVQCEEETLAR